MTLKGVPACTGLLCALVAIVALPMGLFATGSGHPRWAMIAAAGLLGSLGRWCRFYHRGRALRPPTLQAHPPPVLVLEALTASGEFVAEQIANPSAGTVVDDAR
jgi:hypothetical protein